MKHAICLLSLVLVTAGLTLLSINYSWSPITYFLTCLITGGVLGYISARGGYRI